MTDTPTKDSLSGLSLSERVIAQKAIADFHELMKDGLDVPQALQETLDTHTLPLPTQVNIRRAIQEEAQRALEERAAESETKARANTDFRTREAERAKPGNITHR